MTLHASNIPEITSLWQQAENFQSLERESRPPIENLVCEGGGVKGLVYAGALKVMEENGVLQNIKRVAGSSAGGIVSLLLAVGYSPSEIESVMKDEVDFKSLMDRRVSFDPTRVINAAGMKVGVTDIAMLFKHKGLYKGNAFVELAKQLVSRKIEEKLKKIIQENDNIIIERLRNQGHLNGLNETDVEAMIQDHIDRRYLGLLDKYYIDDASSITFEQLNNLAKAYPELHFKELFVTGTKLSDASLKVFSADTDPNMSIVDAVRITMSFPFGFEPVLYQGEYYADGGIADNYPMQIFDQDKFLTHGLNDAKVNPCTLGLLVDSQEEIDARWGVKGTQLEKKLSLKGFVGGVVAGMHNRSEILREYYNINSIQIFDENIETMDLNLDDAKKQKLLASGKNAMQHYMDNYFGKGLQYNNLPDYEDAVEKYYSKRPEELIRIIEEEIWPLMHELHRYNAFLRKIDFPKELDLIEEKLLALSPETVASQSEIFDSLMELADKCEQLQFEDKILDDKIERLEREKRLLWERMDNYDKSKIFDAQAAKWYSEGNDLIAKIGKLNKRKREIQEELVTNKNTYEETQHAIEKDTFELIEQKHRLQYMIDFDFVKKLQKSERILHEHMDLALNALSAYKRDYPDPRVRESLEKDLFVLKEKRHAEYVKHFMGFYDLDEASANKKADEYNEFFDDLLLFGVSIKEANSIVRNYFSNVGAILSMDHPETAGITPDDLRIRMFSQILQTEMISKGLVSDEVDKIFEVREFWKQAVKDNLQTNPEMKRGYAEYLAKEQTFKEWQRRKEEGIELTVSRKASEIFEPNRGRELQYQYAMALNDTIKKLATGRWGDQINLTNREDIEHNLQDKRRQGDNTYGKHTSNYTVTTIDKRPEKVSKFLSFKRKYVKPPIKLNILTPSKNTLQDPEHPMKEIILCFESPPPSDKAHDFSLISKHARNRQKFFEEHQEEFIKKLIFAIAKANEQGLQPPDAKFKITIAGEGLGGQDAQYMLKALVKSINRRSKGDLLRSIDDIELILTDPSRVSKATAEETVKEVKLLKTKHPSINISEYNLLNVHAVAGKTLRRRAQNFIGHSNILSSVDPNDAKVVADFRDSYNPSHHHGFYDNSQDQAALKKELNKSKWLYKTSLYRVFDVKRKGAVKVFGKVIRALPKTAIFLATMPLKAGALTQKRLQNVTSRLIGVFKKKKQDPIAIPKWSSMLTAITKPSTENIALDANQEESMSLERQTDILLVKASQGSRLQREKRPPVENLVLEGGGVKGLVYGGALKEMENNNQLSQLKRVAGSSAGGIAATLLAVGYSPDELMDILANKIDFKELLDTPFSLGGIDTLFEAGGMEIGLTSLISLFKNKGLYKGDAFKQLMDMLIKNKMQSRLKEVLFNQLSNEEIILLKKVPPFLSEEERSKRIDAYLDLKLKDVMREFGIEDLGKITFRQLNDISIKYPNLNLKELYLTGTRLSDASLKVFSAESDPDMPILDAVRITMSFPGGFMPVEYQGDYYADGGIADNYPMQIFDKEKFLSHGVNDSGVNPCTLGLLVDSKEEIESRWGLVVNKSADLKLFDLVGKVLTGIHNRAEILRNKYNINSIQIIDDISTTGTYEGAKVMDLKLSDASKGRLIENGRHAMRFYYDNYTGAEVGYSTIEEYDNLAQKYFGKSTLELKRILHEEVLPLIQEYEQLAESIADKKEELQNEIEELDVELHSFAKEISLCEKLKSVDYELSIHDGKLTKISEDIIALQSHIDGLNQLKAKTVEPYVDSDIPLPKHISEKILYIDGKVREKVLKIDTANEAIERVNKDKSKSSHEREQLLDKLHNLDPVILQSIHRKLDKEDKLSRLEQVQYNMNFILQEREAIIKALRAKGVDFVTPEIAEKPKMSAERRVAPDSEADEMVKKSAVRKKVQDADSDEILLSKQPSVTHDYKRNPKVEKPVKETEHKRPRILSPHESLKKKIDPDLGPKLKKR
jgi:predicted acylesterase/phospholipase RssA